MSKATTVGEQVEIFMHYVGELETLDIPILETWKAWDGPNQPALASAKAVYSITRKRALEPLDVIITHCTDSEAVAIAKKTKERFLEKYPEAE